jgi:EmrB/QacA subfamily drug resistance transporter
VSSSAGAGKARGGLDRRDIHAVLFGAMVSLFLGALDQTIVAPALPSIARDLGQFNAISWVVTAYLLASTAATPIFGKLSDLYGRRRLLLAGLSIFIAGSLGCALAPSMVGLILARALQGIGGGALMSLPNVVIGDVVSPRERGRYQGYFAAVYALSSVAGPVLGGFFSEHLSWTLIFWINLPLGLLGIYVSDRALARLPIIHQEHQIDYLGSLLMASATMGFLLALTWGGHRYPWLSAPIASLLLLAVLLGLGFVLRQRIAAEPILPLSLLTNPVVRMTSVIGLLLVMLSVGVSVYVPLFLELAREMTAQAAGLVLIAPMISIVVGALIAGQYMRFIGRYKLPPIVGLTLVAVSLWVLGRQIQTLSIPWMLLCLAVVGAGIGTGFPTALVATQNAVDPRHLGIATASHAFFRSLGGAIGVALFAAIILGILHSRIALGGAASGLGGDLTEILHRGALGPEDLPQVAAAFAAFFKAASLVALVAAGCFALLKEVPLRGHSAVEAATAQKRPSGSGRAQERQEEDDAAGQK